MSAPTADLPTPPPEPSRRGAADLWRRLAAAGFLAAAAHAAATTSATVDEIHHHLPSGYASLARGSFRLKNGTNPPFLDAAFVVPLWALSPLSAPWDHWAYIDQDRTEFGRQLSFHGGVDLTRILLLVRLLPVLVGTLGVWAVGRTAREMYGPWGGAAAAWAIAACPLWIGHSAILKTDVAAGVFAFLFLTSFARDLRAPSWTGAAVAGILLGGAQLAKYSCLPLVALVPAGLWLGARSRWAHEIRPRAWCVRRAAAVLAIALATMWGGYGFALHPLLHNDADVREKLEIIERCGARLGLGDGTIDTLQRFAMETPIPLADYLDNLPGTFLFALRHGYTQQYFLGEVSERGWWTYYPVGLFLKTPVGFWGILALACAARRRAAPGRGIEEALMIGWAAAYLALTCASRNNSGVRYLFPMLPCVWTLAGRAVHANAGPAARRLAAACLAACVVETVAAHPCHLGHFSAAAGGSARGYQLMRDSNLDMGQGLTALARFEREHPEEAREMAIAYWGGNATEELLDYYGIRARRIPQGSSERTTPLPGIPYVLSASMIDAPGLPHTFSWTRGMRPERVIGGCLYLFRPAAQP